MATTLRRAARTAARIAIPGSGKEATRAVEDIGKADLLDTFDTAWASGLQDLPRDRMDGSEIDGFTAPKR